MAWMDDGLNHIMWANGSEEQADGRTESLAHQLAPAQVEGSFTGSHRQPQALSWALLQRCWCCALARSPLPGPLRGKQARCPAAIGWLYGV